jgi:putative colanic acid biosynthesis acetyltransferase WcaF
MSSRFSLLLKRALWRCVWPFVQWFPKSLSFVRIIVLRFFGASIGKRCLIMPGVKVLMPWNLQFGDEVAIGESVNLYNFATIAIGNGSVVSQYCYLCTGSHDYKSPQKTLIYFPIVVGERCWIASNVFVGPGVTVVDDVVVGACSVVLKNIELNKSVYGGYPAKFIKKIVQ